MKTAFPYAAVALPRGATGYRPMLKVRLLAASGEHYDCFALADSGADTCLFPLRMARFLKLDLAQMRRGMTGGVGSSGNLTYYGLLTLELGEGLKFEAEVGFTAGMDRTNIGLLGQSGFFENYNVEFLYREKRFTIEQS